MKFERLTVSDMLRFNNDTKKLEHYYQAKINLSSQKEHTIELNITEDENKEIIKVVAPILEKAFSDIKDEVKKELA